MIKKAALSMALCLFLSVLAGCKNEDSVPNAGSSDSATTTQFQAADFLPITKNTKYLYQGEGNEYASYSVYNDYTSANQIQQRVDNGGTVSARVLTLEDGKLIQTFSSGEVYYRENVLGKTGTQEVLLSEPIIQGTTWTTDDGSSRTITGTSVQISTPSGDYDAIEVTTDGTDGTTIQYYAKGIGLIQMVYRSGESEISSTLSSIEQDVPMSQTVRFFYPGTAGDAIYYEDRDLDFYTNDSTKDILAETYKNTPDNLAAVFSSGTAIRSLTLRDDGVVALDLNQSFLTEMNAGSGYEAMILQSIADTFGQYYGTDQVLLTIEGDLYSSGHFAFHEGEYLQADFSSPTPLPTE